MITFALAVALLSAPAPLQGPATERPIILDGRFDDWAGVRPVLIDPPDARLGAIDIGAVKIVDDPGFVHLLVELGRTVNLQRLDGTLEILFDADGDAATGATVEGLKGIDLIVTFSPPDARNPQRPGMGVGARRWVDRAWRPISPYALGIAFAPTAASNRAEIRFGRGLPADAPLFVGDRIGGKLIHRDAAGAIVDETDSFAFRFSSRPAPTVPPDPEVDPIRRAPGTALRVMTWNVERGAMFSNPEPFARVLRALEPDVILFQELLEEHRAEQVAGWLAQHAGEGGSPWHAVVGSGGGQLRTAVATRHPAQAVPELDRASWTDERGRRRDVRLAAAEVMIPGAAAATEETAPRLPVLVFSVHLKCCGGARTEEELTRLEEVQAIRYAYRTVVQGGRFAGVVLGGDLNLVGSFEPLEELIEGIDIDGTNKAIGVAPKLCGRMHATWSDDGQPFTPGQLDFVLYGSAALRQLGGFALDTRDLSPRWLEHHGLDAADTAASDHWPVVVDLGWRRLSSTSTPR
ncbi:MAG TPA: endonuclease/exonuclease/phosphatase family protein [Phycisphaerales bacterium]|nr:endonuclease/exonuclease/phosphatase family protein [Phycisphaerales bacterium]HMP36541.1 endonuclease/exonuclease/phosphatase family protein [Phycisphaerales bacterium]